MPEYALTLSVFARAADTDRFPNAAAATINSPTKELEEMAMDVAHRFKRRVLGICGESSQKKPSELAMILHEIGIAPSADDAMDILPKMLYHKIRYTKSPLHPYIQIVDKSTVLDMSSDKIRTHYYTISVCYGDF